MGRQRASAGERQEFRDERGVLGQLKPVVAAETVTFQPGDPPHRSRSRRSARPPLPHPPGPIAPLVATRAGLDGWRLALGMPRVSDEEWGRLPRDPLTGLRVVLDAAGGVANPLTHHC